MSHSHGMVMRPPFLGDFAESLEPPEPPEPEAGELRTQSVGGADAMFFFAAALPGVSGSVSLAPGASSASISAAVPAAVGLGHSATVTLSSAVGAAVATASTTSTVPPAETAAPAAAGSVHAWASGTTVDLTWSDVEDERGYRIERATESAQFVFVGAAGPDVTNYSIPDLQPGTRYRFRVVPWNYRGFGLAVEDVVDTVPLAPAHLWADPSTPGAITISWDEVSAEIGYEIRRQAAGGAWQYLGNFSGTTQYTDSSGIVPGTIYTYEVSPWNWAGSVSATVSVTSAPAAPSGFHAAAINGVMVELRFYADSGSVEIERSEPGFNYGYVGGQSLSGSGYQAIRLVGGLDDRFRIRLGKDGVYSEFVATAVTLPAPTGVAISDVAARGLTLTWASSYSGGTYAIEQATAAAWGVPGSFAEIGRTDGNSYQVPRLEPGTTYFFRVRLVVGSHTSGYSAQGSATTLSTIANPSGLALVTDSTFGFPSYIPVLKFNDNSSNEQGFYVEAYSPDAPVLGLGGPWVSAPIAFFLPPAEGSPENEQTFVPFIAPPWMYEFWYWPNMVYRVRAYGANGEYSGPSNEVTFSPSMPLAAPGLDVVGTTTDQVTLRVTYSGTATVLLYRLDSVISTFPESAGILSFGPDAADNTQTITIPNPLSLPLFSGTEYYFGAIAYSGPDASVFGITSATTQALVTPPPPAPSAPDLSGAPVKATAVDLSWTDSDHETSYTVQRAVPVAAPALPSYTNIAIVAANVTSYRVEGLEPETPYLYRVVAVNSLGSTNSDEAAVTTGTLAAPGDLSLTRVGRTRAMATWTNLPDEETGYRLTLVGSDGSTIVSNLGADASQATLAGLIPGVAYSATLVATRGTHESAGRSATVTLDNPQTLSVLATTFAAEWGLKPKQVEDPGELLVIRGGDLSAELTVNYQIAGSAAPGSDYQILSGSVTIPANQRVAQVIVKPILDSVTRSTDVTLELTAGEGYQVASGGGFSLVEIDDPMLRYSVPALPRASRKTDWPDVPPGIAGHGFGGVTFRATAADPGIPDEVAAAKINLVIARPTDAELSGTLTRDPVDPWKWTYSSPVELQADKDPARIDVVLRDTNDATATPDRGTMMVLSVFKYLTTSPLLQNQAGVNYIVWKYASILQPEFRERRPGTASPTLYYPTYKSNQPNAGFTHAISGKIEIGPSAMHNENMLVSTIGHEGVHRYEQSPAVRIADPEVKEPKAYKWELDHAADTGISRAYWDDTLQAYNDLGHLYPGQYPE